MGELTLWVCSLASVVLMLMVLAVAIVCTMDRRDSSEVARLRAAGCARPLQKEALTMVFVYDLGDVVAVTVIALGLISFGYLKADAALRRRRARREAVRP